MPFILFCSCDSATVQADCSLSPADVVGGWDDVEVGFLLGRGSSGSVYRAKCNGKLVAVKVC